MNTKPQKPWYPAELARLDSLATRHTDKEIGAILGRSELSVRRRRQRRDRVAALVAAIDAEPVPALKRRLRKQLVLTVWRRRAVGRS